MSPEWIRVSAVLSFRPLFFFVVVLPFRMRKEKGIRLARREWDAFGVAGDFRIYLKFGWYQLLLKRLPCETIWKWSTTKCVNNTYGALMSFVNVTSFFSVVDSSIVNYNRDCVSTWGITEWWGPTQHQVFCENVYFDRWQRLILIT